MSTLTFTLRGDQIVRFDTLSGDGNGTDRVVTLTGTRALGSASEIYTITVEQVGAGETQFTNGQFITITDSAGNIIVPRSGVQPDIEQGLGGGDEHLILPGSNIVIDVGGLPATPTTTTYGLASQVASQSLGDNDGELDFADVRTSFPCFAEGTRIATPGGERLVEALREGDLIETKDAGPQHIRWLRSRTQVLRDADDPQRPILIAPGALGPGEPRRTLAVSQQHRILAQAAEGEVLFPAKALLSRRGVRVARGMRRVRYFTILTSRHQILRANGLWCETFYPGPYMLATLSPDLRADLARTLPLLGIDVRLAYGPPARPLWTVGQARRMAVPAG